MLEELFDEIHQKRSQDLALNRHNIPRRNPTASDLSKCPREMALSIIHWEERPEPEEPLLKRFEVGNQKERQNISKLMSLGIQVVEHQSSFDLRDKSGRLVMSGHIDGKFYWKGKAYPFDHKTSHPLVYARVNTVDDLLRHKYLYKYVNQIMAYQYLNNIDVGALWLDNLLGDWKFIEVPLDWEMMEKILQNCEAAVDSVEKVRGGADELATLPGFYSDPSFCSNCWAFKRLCNPPWSAGEGMSVIEGTELEAKISRRAALDEAATEYDALDREIKETFKTMGLKEDQSYLVGDWLVSAKKRHRKAFSVKESDYFIYSVDSINQPGKGKG